MSYRHTRKRVSLGGVVALVLTLSTVELSAKETEAEETTSVSVVELQQQRLEVLETLVEVTAEGYLIGNIDYSEHVAAQQLVVNAKLELTDDRAARLALLKQSVKLAEEVVKKTEARFALGKVTQREVLVYRSDLLMAKIRLEKERSEGESKKLSQQPERP